MDMQRFQELEKKLPPRKKKFLEIFSVCGKASEAVKLAGYKCGTGHTAASMAWNMLNEPDCAEYLELLRQYAKDTTVVTATRLLDEQMQLAFFDASEFIDENGKFVSKAAFKRAGKNIKSIAYNSKTGARKVEFYDKQDALDKIARYVGWYEKDNEQIKPDGVQFYLPENNRPDSSSSS